MLFGTRSISGGRPIEYIIVGLGNPGRKYERTRHNTGFMALDALAESCGIAVDRVKWNALTGDGSVNGHRCLLMKPQTFMNCSGEAVTAAMRFHKIPPERVLVMLDDINLDVGVVRIRRSGSDGGQKGMRSIIELSGSSAFPRIKLGVGSKPDPRYDLADWVLSSYTESELKIIKEAAANAAKATELIVDGKMDQAMSAFSK